MPEPIAWQLASLKAIRRETDTVSTFTLQLPAWRPHRAGQHYDVRLTAPDGYQAQRSYSIASPPSRPGEIDLGVERIPDGEVSPYFHDVLTVGDLVEVRGPIGGYFVWEPGLGGPPSGASTSASIERSIRRPYPLQPGGCARVRVWTTRSPSFVAASRSSS